jgi:hypothetical protein
MAEKDTYETAPVSQSDLSKGTILAADWIAAAT